MRFMLVALALGAVAADFRHFEDATLRAVQFVDRHEGWCVGDEGVVWHTIDGGKTWERQPTGIRASLRSLHFVSPYVGWAAGREELPNGAGSVGYLLHTTDGGLKWRVAARNTLPGLNAVRFVNEKVGFVAGDGSDQFPTGLFATKDGGRTWQPVPGPRCPSWLAADFKDGQTGILAGAWSWLAALQDGTLGKHDTDPLGGRNLCSLVLDGSRAVAVGQGGAVLLSASAGARWSYADLKLPREARFDWDFRAVHCYGDHFWAVGRPGSAVLHTPDWGKTWEVQKTGQPLPLHGVFFKDDRHGWAVGELGCILGTVDGGKTWKPLQRGGLQAAVLFVHSRPLGLPVETLAQVGGDEGFLAAAVRVHAPDSTSSAPARAVEEQRWSMAVSRSGGAAGEMLWQFPLPQHRSRATKGDLMKAWDAAHDDHAAEHYLRQLVLALRTWKPAVVITDHPDAAVSGQASDALLAEAVHEAFLRAGDPATFPEQLETLGLEAWQPGKLYGRWEDRGTANVVLDGNALSGRLEASYRDFAGGNVGLLTEGSTGAPPTLPTERFYRLLDSKLPGADKHSSLMEGVALAPGGTSRRELLAAVEPTPEVIKAMRARRNLETLAGAPLGKANPDQLLGQLAPLLAAMPDDQASAAAYSLGSHFARSGQWLLAREVFLHMVDHYPAQPRAADAYRWLVRHGCSSEARRRVELGQFILTSNFAYHSLASKAEVKQADYKGEAVGSSGGQAASGTQKSTKASDAAQQVVGNAALTFLGNRNETRQWYIGSLAVADRLAAFGPLYATDPALHFCLQSARRNLGDLDKNQEWLTQFRDSSSDGPWRAAAAAELWLAQRVGAPPKPVLLCRQTAARPVLDGRFEDECWQGLKPVVLRNAVGDTAKQYVTEVRMAYDQQHLYLALRCTHPDDQHVEPVKVRSRDADLRPFDRVSLMLDLDRDYASYFQLHVDQRGCVRDDCGLGSEADVTWDPRWFVAVHSEASCWQIEAAIPLVELTGDKVTLGKSWACNVVRVLPGRGVQALSMPADVEPRPEGMGLLLFAPNQLPLGK